VTGQKLTFFQCDRKKGGEGGEAGVGGDEVFAARHHLHRFHRLFRGQFRKMSQSTPVMIVVALRIFGVGAEVPHQIKAIKDSPTSSLRCQHVRTI
jgi:hypothetical protein